VGVAPAHDLVGGAVRAGKGGSTGASCRRGQGFGFRCAGIQQGSFGRKLSGRHTRPCERRRPSTEWFVVDSFRFAPQQTATPVISRRASSTSEGQKELTEIKPDIKVRDAGERPGARLTGNRGRRQPVYCESAPDPAKKYFCACWVLVIPVNLTVS
jgi:hypothetical protein